MPLVRQAPYSPDLAPCDFWLFPKLKLTLERETISVQRRHYEKIDGGASGHCGGGVQEVFSEVAEALGKVCAPPRGIF